MHLCWCNINFTHTMDLKALKIPQKHFIFYDIVQGHKIVMKFRGPWKKMSWKFFKPIKMNFRGPWNGAFKIYFLVLAQKLTEMVLNNTDWRAIISACFTITIWKYRTNHGIVKLVSLLLCKFNLRTFFLK